MRPVYCCSKACAIRLALRAIANIAMQASRGMPTASGSSAAMISMLAGGRRLGLTLRHHRGRHLADPAQPHRQPDGAEGAVAERSGSGANGRGQDLRKRGGEFLRDLLKTRRTRVEFVCPFGSRQNSLGIDQMKTVVGIAFQT